MGGLVLVLSNPDLSVVTLALETLLLIAEDEASRPEMKSYIGMQEQLEALLKRCDCDNNIKILAERLLLLLTGMHTVTQTHLKDTSNIPTSRKPSCQKTVQELNGRGNKSVALQLHGVFDQADRDLCMRLLLKVKGVISITFDMTKKRCLLRVKFDVKPESLVRAIAKSMTMSARQIIKNENGDETLVSFNVSEHQGTECVRHEKENEDLLPPYLSEDEKNDAEEDANAVSRGLTTDSTASKWFSAAASFLTNSFFW
ncbi:hypothetical protein C0Q70_16677 [Pomacea canaliculata]|uniref:Armadillo repeat-containing protein 1 n=2 Tax=Pomacea canaliculata TaxID=400727 RepID=A0A2T7NQG1_POMCA|nr:hypothetical protein C0Q70_16677 [Pomacea canaliculata]